MQSVFIEATLEVTHSLVQPTPVNFISQKIQAHVRLGQLTRHKQGRSSHRQLSSTWYSTILNTADTNLVFPQLTELKHEV